MISRFIILIGLFLFCCECYAGSISARDLIALSKTYPDSAATLAELEYTKRQGADRGDYAFAAAMAYRAQSDFQNAVRMYLAAYDVYLSTRESLKQEATLINLANIYTMAGLYAESDAIMQGLLGGTTSPHTAKVHFTLALNQKHIANHSLAIELLLKAREHYELDQNQRMVSTCNYEIGLALVASGREEDGKEYFARATGASSLLDGQVENQLGLIAEGAEDFEAAEQHYAMAVEKLGAEPRHIATPLINLAQLKGDVSLAREGYHAAVNAGDIEDVLRAAQICDALAGGDIDILRDAQRYLREEYRYTQQQLGKEQYKVIMTLLDTYRVTRRAAQVEGERDMALIMLAVGLLGCLLLYSEVKRRKDGIKNLRNLLDEAQSAILGKR